MMITPDRYYEIYVSPDTRTIAVTFFGDWPEDVKKYTFTNFIDRGINFHARKSLPWPVQDSNEYIFTWKYDPDIQADM
jgi:hypothetical protein